MYYFATYFDINYLPRGLSLIDSLDRHSDKFTIYVLCMDDECMQGIRSVNRPNIHPISLADVENASPDLILTKPDRSQLEYYYTCGPAFLCYLMDKFTEIDLITYLDADLYFYSNPKQLFDHFNDYSIGVIPHQLKKHRKHTWQGKYNVGWINFRRDFDGMACLRWWRDRCIEWCYMHYEDGKFGDQLYLDEWPDLFRGVYEYKDPGADVGAWNVKDYLFSLKEEKVYVDEEPLIFYHFHGFKKISKNIYNASLGFMTRPLNPILRKHVFSAYIKNLEKYSINSNPTQSISEYRPKHHTIKNLARIFLSIVFRQYLIYYRGRII